MGTVRLPNFMPPSSGRAYTSDRESRKIFLLFQCSSPHLRYYNMDLLANGLIMAPMSLFILAKRFESRERLECTP